MNEQEMDIIKHSLGVRKFDDKPYKNRYVIGPDQDGFELLQSMAERGLMKDHGAQSIAAGMHCFSVTDAGEAQMWTQWQDSLPPEPKLTKRQKLNKECYQAFVRADYFTGEFIQFVRRWKQKQRENQRGY